jgi:uncharacterized membrane protein YciS (DUF1049 family)
MSETTLFIAGVVVSAIVFTGLFMYLMLSFSKFAERTQGGTGKLKE